MSSLDSQFMCMGTMFTNDIVVDIFGRDRFNDKQLIFMARGFIIAIVVVTYIICLMVPGKAIFPLAVWCFSGFGALFPIIIAALYWKRATSAGIIAAILATSSVWIYAFTVLRTPKNRYGLVADMMPATFMFGACLITLIVVSLLTAPPSRITIDKFFPTQMEKTS
jgi:SSS family solute:Na+ symporter